MPEVDYERLEMAHLTPRQSVDLSAQETNHGPYAWSGLDDFNKPNSQSITTHDELLASDSRSIGETSATCAKLSIVSPKPTSKSISSTLGSWWREIVAMIISIASLVSIAAVLLVYQKRPLSDWQFRYLPNAVVSQLVTISRSALMFSTASSVSQSIWVHVQQKPRSLIDFQSFDDASRGPFGAALMLAHATRYCLPALLGSFITIATLLMESFTQQILRFPLRPDLDKLNGTYPTTQYFAYAPNQYLASDAAVNSSIQAAIVDSIFGNPPADGFTENMGIETWTDIATSVRLNAGVANSTLISFASLTWSGPDFVAPPNITECSLSWVDSHDLEYSYHWDAGSSGWEWFVFEATGNGLPPGSNSTFTVHQGNLESLQTFVQGVLNLGNSIQYTQSETLLASSGKFDFGILMLNNPTTSDMSNSLAKGLTNIIRNMTTPYANKVLGKTHIQVQYIQVRWQWLTLPAAVVFLGLLLLIATIIQSHRSASMVWKSSPLALLFHPLHGWTDEELSRDSRSDMVDSAKRMRGQLLHTEDSGYRITRAS
ncbi:hypothetical protein KCU65_g4232, partial [Aureobasidium melanogenum]